ncbi:hypothetical protein [Marinicella gelatinilytica]|uniref:hypothetical protein n=1 Tax=Marinicella gelatinilytica TaxID=2996017 RepID=UPI0022608998|nr:hypothetical protein [Marinicella gelatinilytica]MCX7545114.1 hypothetical protein [Marinicella gelatinilytica]
MKKLLTVSLFMLSATTFAMDADQLKENDLKTCQQQALSAPEDQQDHKKETCECIVNNTDYEALAEARQEGDMDKLNELKAEAADQCDA